MILVGDIGGTRTRLAIAEKGPDSWRLMDIEERPTGIDILKVIGRYLADRGAKPIEAAAFCGAGPVSLDGSIRLTNTNVLLEPAALARAARLPRAILINDFAAIAEAIPHVPASSLVQCGGGSPVSAAPVIVMGPGTGLGVAIATPSAGGWIAITGDGGHADLAPVDDEELEIWQKLRAMLPRVSAESVLCGPGLERLYGLLADGERRAAAEIAEAAARGEPPAVRTLAVFTRWLGSVAGNLALIAGANGGVYLAGGILPRLGPLFDKALFRAAFEDKSPHGRWLREIPTYIVMYPQPGLLGLAVLAAATT